VFLKMKGICVVVVLWWGLVLSLQVLVGLANEYPNITYVSYVGYLVNPSYLDEGATVVLSQTNEANDSPFTRIDLPFNFPVFGTTWNRVFVNPNGALHQTSALPCKSGAFYGTVATGGTCQWFQNSYYGLIAGFLADLNPYVSSASNITYRVTNEHLFVNFHAIPFYNYGSGQTNSFSFELGSDGRVIIRYAHVNAATSVKFYYQDWISGLRVPSDSTQIHNVFSTQQLSIPSKAWNTNVRGIYPKSRSTVQSNRQFVACPLSTSWCVSPKLLLFYDSAADSSDVAMFSAISRMLAEVANGTISNSSATDDSNSTHTDDYTDDADDIDDVDDTDDGGTLMPVTIQNVTGNFVVNITALSASCADYLDIGIQVVETAANITAINTVTCNRTEGSGTGITRFSCDITTPVYAIMTNQTNILLKELQVNIVSRATNSTQKSSNVYSIIGTIKPLFINLVNASDGVAQSVYDDSSSSSRCYTNTLPFTDQSDCDLCDSTISNPNTCSVASQNSSKELYTYPTCYNVAGYKTNCSSSLYYDSANKKCCDVGEIDCFGVCSGTAVTAPGPLGNMMCCSLKLVDCNGICGGNVTYDDCGVCGGIITSATDCNDGNAQLQAGAAWPMFARNVNHMSVSPFQAVVNTSEDSTESTVNWNLDLCPETYSSPVIDNQGTMYVGCEDGYMYALVENPTSQYSSPVTRFSYNTGASIRTTAVIDSSSILYFGNTNFTFYALNTLTSKLSWSKVFNTGKLLFSSPPAIYGSYIYVVGVFSLTGASRLFALTKSTGSKQWSTVIHSGANMTYVSSSPMISRGLIYLHTFATANTTERSMIKIFRLSTGQLVTSKLLVNANNDHLSVNISTTSPSVPSPVRLPDQSVIAVTVDGVFTRFAIDHSTVTKSSPTVDFYYSRSLSLIVLSTPIIYAPLELVFICSYNGTIVAMNMSSGETMWTTTLTSTLGTLTITSTGVVSEPSGLLLVPTSVALDTLNISTGSVLSKSTVSSTSASSAVATVRASAVTQISSGGISSVAIASDGSVRYAVSSTGSISSVGGTSSTCPSGQGVSSSFNATWLPPSFSSSNGLCSSCGTGYHSSSSICAPCSPGYYSNASGLTTCFTCEAMFYQSSYGASSCSSSCSTGSYSDAGASSCTGCAAGTELSYTAGQYGCSTCSIGRYSSAGSTSCSTCTSGYTTSAAGASECSVACDAGWYGVLVNTTALGASCLQCPLHTYSNMQASTECIACATGLFTSGIGSTVCDSCEDGKYFDNVTNTCVTCDWPYYPKNSADSSCSYYLLIPLNDRIGFVVNIAFIMSFLLIVALMVFSLDTSLTDVEQQAGFVVTRLGFFICMLPAWLEQLLQVLYVINIPFTSIQAFMGYLILRFCYPFVAVGLIVGSVTDNVLWACVSLRLIRLVLVGGGLFMMKGLSLRSVYNRFLYSVTGNRGRDYLVSPIVVELENISSFVGFFVHTVPLLILVVVSSAPTQFWYRQVIFIVYLIAAACRFLPLLLYFIRGSSTSRFTMSTMPLSVKVGPFTWLYVYGDNDGVSRARRAAAMSIASNSPVRARPVAINDLSYADVPVAPVALVEANKVEEDEEIFYYSPGGLNNSNDSGERAFVETELVHSDDSGNVGADLTTMDDEYNVDGGGDDGSATVISVRTPAVARSVNSPPSAPVSPTASSAAVMGRGFGSHSNLATLSGPAIASPAPITTSQPTPGLVPIAASSRPAPIYPTAAASGLAPTSRRFGSHDNLATLPRTGNPSPSPVPLPTPVMPLQAPSPVWRGNGSPSPVQLSTAALPPQSPTKRSNTTPLHTPLSTVALVPQSSTLPLSASPTAAAVPGPVGRGFPRSGTLSDMN
jgi:outer membrane protein assembly factor BamB